MERVSLTDAEKGDHRRLLQQQTTLARFGELALKSDDLDEILTEACRLVGGALGTDLAKVVEQSKDNPVFYVQYCHARVSSLRKNAVEQGVMVPPWSQVDFAPLALPEEQTLIKRLLQFPELVEGAARAREPHRVAYYLTELAGLFHPYYKAHRVITDDRAQTLARLGLAAAVGQVVRNGLGLLGVSAPESM